MCYAMEVDSFYTDFCKIHVLKKVVNQSLVSLELIILNEKQTEIFFSGGMNMRNLACPPVSFLSGSLLWNIFWTEQIGQAAVCVFSQCFMED